MYSQIYWIDSVETGRLVIMPRPRAGDWLEDEIAAWKDAAVDTVLCLLEREEIDELGLRHEAELCRARGIEWLSFPIRDRGLPSSTGETLALATSLLARLRAGQVVAVHCRAGIGRSALIAACVMIVSGIDASDAFTRIAAARGTQVPDTEEQRDWAQSF
jgi:protein-tyrosine phosphatase